MYIYCRPIVIRLYYTNASALTGKLGVTIINELPSCAMCRVQIVAYSVTKMIRRGNDCHLQHKKGYE